jgi:hypothetical protein
VKNGAPGSWPIYKVSMKYIDRTNSPEKNDLVVCTMFRNLKVLWYQHRRKLCSFTWQLLRRLLATGPLYELILSIENRSYLFYTRHTCTLQAFSGTCWLQWTTVLLYLILWWKKWIPWLFTSSVWYYHYYYFS